MANLFKAYVRVSLVVRILAGFLLGSVAGVALWAVSRALQLPLTLQVLPYISPFGTVLINMLKMIVIPVIFFSLVVGAASLPLKRFGRIGVKVLGWYLLCSLLAACIGVVLALVINPGGGSDLTGWEQMAGSLSAQAGDIAGESAVSSSFVDVLLNMFQNPFQALANGNFLSIIVFSIMFGIGIRVSIESAATLESVKQHMQLITDLLSAARDVMFKLVDWILEYSPIGVFALSVVNFSLYGPNIVGPYVRVTLGIIAGIGTMIFVVYPALIALVNRVQPYRVMKNMQEAIITAFITRSSAATLPVSLRVADEELGVQSELAGFSLPLGATINMDGVCVHLPMFAVLAANMFGLPITFTGLLVLVLTTVLASIGAGGVPGGSLMLLFIILQTMGLSADQVAVIVAIALGINPVLDMFETANNVTGDLVCTYAVAGREKMLR